MKIFNNKKLQTGDTIVEVIFAVTVFSMLLVGTIAIMNRGTSVIQRSLEISLVRQQIDSQAESLRYINGYYLKNMGDEASSDKIRKMWNDISSEDIRMEDYPKMDQNATSCTTPDSSPNAKSFAFSFKSANSSERVGLDLIKGDSQLVPADTFSQIDNNGLKAKGLWINSVKKSNQEKYIDFVIRACWDSPGSNVPMQLSTVVRLYDPRI